MSDEWEPWMSDEINRIREWQQQNRAANFGAAFVVDDHQRHVGILLAVVDRLEAIVSDLAATAPGVIVAQGDPYCHYCLAKSWPHESECLWRRARELMGESND